MLIRLIFLLPVGLILALCTQGLCLSSLTRVLRIKSPRLGTMALNTLTRQ